MHSRLRVAEFFAGSGLVRKALEAEGFRVVFANDNDETKFKIYAANFGGDEFVLRSIADLSGEEIPSVDLATVSFPCTDLSLAGERSGLDGAESGLFWEFTRILDEMGERRPPVLSIENVPGFLTSNGGQDLAQAIGRLNQLGYSCDLLALDARWFVPQSRPRLFIVGALEPTKEPVELRESLLRPRNIVEFMASNPQLTFHCRRLHEPEPAITSLTSIIGRFSANDEIWWDEQRLTAFVDSLSAVQSQRLDALRSSNRLTWSTAYRRTRNGAPVWEIRADRIAGCLRTTRGGSSRQAVVEAGRGAVRVRWMTAREYARLQGAGDFSFGPLSESQARFALGDAVCVPVVRWLARHYLRPALEGSRKAAAAG